MEGVGCNKTSRFYPDLRLNLGPFRASHGLREEYVLVTGYTSCRC